MYQEEWKREVKKPVKDLTPKINVLYAKKRKINKDLEIMENDMLSELIKMDFNLNKTPKTVRGLKNFHAERGWIEEGMWDIENDDQYVNFNVETNGGKFYMCETANVPYDCWWGFPGGDPQFDAKSCRYALIHDWRSCKNWQKLDQEPPIPKQGESYIK